MISNNRKWVFCQMTLISFGGGYFYLLIEPACACGPCHVLADLVSLQNSNVSSMYPLGMIPGMIGGCLENVREASKVNPTR